MGSIMSKKKKEQAELNNDEEKHIAFNKQIFLLIFMFVLFLLLGVSVLSSKDGLGYAIFFLILCLVPIFAFLISPMYIVFTPREITVVYLWGLKERIEWKQIRNITEYGSYLVKGSGLPEYQIAYPRKEKYPFFVDSSIPKTHKTKKMVKRYYKGSII